MAGTFRRLLRPRRYVGMRARNAVPSWEKRLFPAVVIPITALALGLAWGPISPGETDIFGFQACEPLPRSVSDWASNNAWEGWGEKLNRFVKRICGGWKDLAGIGEGITRQRSALGGVAVITGEVSGSVQPGQLAAQGKQLIDSLPDQHAESAGPAGTFPEWVERVFQALNHPLMALILLLVGFTAAFVEANSPGLGLPGFVALVCFGLFFWSTFLGGTSTWLEFTLFTLGVVCLVIELILPGFGIFGIGGWVLILLGLILARAHAHWPPTPEMVRGVIEGAMVVAGALLGALLLTVGLVALLGRTGGAGGIVLPPPDESAGGAGPGTTDLGVKVGDVGVAVTRLLLCGKAKFGGRILDVKSQSVPVDAGKKVRVVEVRGHLVVVDPVEEAPEELASV